METPPGTLFVVATPIGNLGDLAPRAVEVLRGADVIACEDTRVTGKLKGRFGITTPLVSHHEHNERARTPALVARLKAGESIALVSDAGSPLVSDPGFLLVRAAREAGLRVRTIPGPSAVLAALAVSGLPPQPFTCFGFAPARRGARRERFFDQVAAAPGSVVLFESPARTARLLRDLAERLGPRQTSLSREMTKLHEDHWFGTLDELAARAEKQPPRGEVTLVVGPEPVRGKQACR